MKVISSPLSKKVVLARKTEFNVSGEINAFNVLTHLTKLKAPRYNFLFQFNNDSVFLGSSPERLYKRTLDNIESSAIAGTNNRSIKNKDDIKLGKALLNSTKDQKEHDFVLNSIKKTFKQLCSHYKFCDKKSLLKLHEGQHLVVNFSGKLKENIDDNFIISHLHPTPAVGGYPKNKAIQFLKDNEIFERGWYSGGIGAIGLNEVDLAVAIRSALITGNKLNVYAGVGIVAESEADKEWRELEYKIINFKESINYEDK